MIVAMDDSTGATTTTWRWWLERCGALYRNIVVWHRIVAGLKLVHVSFDDGQHGPHVAAGSVGKQHILGDVEI